MTLSRVTASHHFLASVGSDTMTPQYKICVVLVSGIQASPEQVWHILVMLQLGIQSLVYTKVQATTVTQAVIQTVYYCTRKSFEQINSSSDRLHTA